MEKNKQKNEQDHKQGNALVIQIVKFGLVGVSNTVVSYVVYSVCYYLFHTNVHIANVTAFLISVLWAFLMQSKFVFVEDENAKKRVWWKVLIKTYISYAFSGLVLTELLLVFWLNIVHIELYMSALVDLLHNVGITMKAKDLAVSIVPFMNMAVTIPVNFCVNKFWAYRQKQ